MVEAELVSGQNEVPQASRSDGMSVSTVFSHKQQVAQQRTDVFIKCYSPELFMFNVAFIGVLFYPLVLFF